MAHECIDCGSECHCSGDIDDVNTSLTPFNCKGCTVYKEEIKGDDSFLYDDGFDDYFEDHEDGAIGYQCVNCGVSRSKPSNCPFCEMEMEPYG